MRPALPLLVLLAFAACAQFPELDARTSRAAGEAPYPALLPLDSLLADAYAPERSARSDRAVRGVEGRAAALRRRAAALRDRPVIDAATRARLLAAVARHAG